MKGTITQFCPVSECLDIHGAASTNYSRKFQPKVGNQEPVPNMQIYNPERAPPPITRTFSGNEFRTSKCSAKTRGAFHKELPPDGAVDVAMTRGGRGGANCLLLHFPKLLPQFSVKI